MDSAVGNQLPGNWRRLQLGIERIILIRLALPCHYYRLGTSQCMTPICFRREIFPEAPFLCKGRGWAPNSWELARITRIGLINKGLFSNREVFHIKPTFWDQTMMNMKIIERWDEQRCEIKEWKTLPTIRYNLWRLSEGVDIDEWKKTSQLNTQCNMIFENSVK